MVPTSVLPRQNGFASSAGRPACALGDRIRDLKAPINLRFAAAQVVYGRED